MLAKMLTAAKWRHNRRKLYETVKGRQFQASENGGFAAALMFN